MTAYHEINPAQLDSVLKNGLDCSSRGEKSDEVIEKTDSLLDAAIPKILRIAGLSRSNNLYAYLYEDNLISRITDGKKMTVDDFVSNSDRAVLRLEVDARHSYISDLDAYDTVKTAVGQQAGLPARQAAAAAYWAAICRAADYRSGQVKRPEVMITYPIEPSNIQVISPGKA